MLYAVLDVYIPPRWDVWEVARHLTGLTKSLGLTPLCDPAQKTQFTADWFSTRLSAEIRRRTPNNPRAEGWHQDGDLDKGSIMDHALVLWSTNTPVELKVGDKIYQPKPHEVILVKNLSCVHRRPPYAQRVRWRFRQKVKNDEIVDNLLQI